MKSSICAGDDVTSDAPHTETRRWMQLFIAHSPRSWASGIASIRANNESGNDGNRLTANGERVSSMQVKSDQILNSKWLRNGHGNWQLAIALQMTIRDGSVALLPAVKKNSAIGVPVCCDFVGPVVVNHGYPCHVINATALIVEKHKSQSLSLRWRRPPRRRVGQC